MAAVSIRQANKKKWARSSQEGQQELLPGIPDDVALHVICPKLSWKESYGLSSVSRAWLDAIRSRKVYDARVRSHSTETFLIVNLDRLSGGIALWSTRGNFLVKLPPIRHRSHHMVSLDGRIYLVGMAKNVGRDFNNWDSFISDEVFVLDVAGRGQWRKCASMGEPRTQFRCALMHGKIYVCGGYKIETIYRKFCGSEVYNPETDLWSPIKPMPERHFQKTPIVGQEMFVRGSDASGVVGFVDVYHPGKDEWRVLTPFGRGGQCLWFAAQGKLHSMDHLGIYVFNAEEVSWTRLHSFSSLFGLSSSIHMSEVSVLAVDDDLLLRYRVRKDFYNKYACLAKCSGFGSEKMEIVWHKVPFTHFLQNSNELTAILL